MIATDVKICPKCSKEITAQHSVRIWDDGPKTPSGKSQWVHKDCNGKKPRQSKTIHAEIVAEAMKLVNGIDYSQVDREINDLIDSRVSGYKAETDDKLKLFVEGVCESIDKAVEQVNASAEAVAKKTIENLAPRTIEIVTPDETRIKIEGYVHPEFEKVLKLAGMRKNILLTGPAGCGKSHLAEQVSTALGLRFASLSCSAGMSEGHLTGRLLPTGDAGRFEYSISDFVACYEAGGVFLLDEIDAADPNVLLVVNSALANGRLPVPNRTENPVAKRHKDFVLIAAANTFGRGADRLYVGRNELDESTLDRFRIGSVEMNYDPELEKVLCPDDKLRGLLQGYRKKCHKARLERIISTRFLRDAYDMLSVGWSSQDIENQLFSGWSKDELSKVK